MKTEENQQPIRVPKPCATTSHLSGALIIIAVGVVFLLGNLNIIESGSVFRYWPVLLIVVGLKKLFETTDRGSAVVGVFIAAIGSLFLLDNLGFINFSIWQLWPLFLIMLGFKMLMQSLPASAGRMETKEGSGNSGLSKDSTFSCIAIMGGAKRNIGSGAFRGGAATAIMGGVELDLRQATIEGAQAEIEVFAMMGGAEIRIPETWTLESKVVTILGGLEDKTTPPADNSKRLVLRGTVLLGGVEVKN